MIYTEPHTWEEFRTTLATALSKAGYKDLAEHVTVTDIHDPSVVPLMRLYEELQFDPQDDTENFWESHGKLLSEGFNAFAECLNDIIDCGLLALPKVDSMRIARQLTCELRGTSYRPEGDRGQVGLLSESSEIHDEIEEGINPEDYSLDGAPEFDYFVRDVRDAVVSVGGEYADAVLPCIDVSSDLIKNFYQRALAFWRDEQAEYDGFWHAVEVEIIDMIVACYGEQLPKRLSKTKRSMLMGDVMPFASDVADKLTADHMSMNIDEAYERYLRENNDNADKTRPTYEEFCMRIVSVLNDLKEHDLASYVKDIGCKTADMSQAYKEANVEWDFIQSGEEGPPSPSDTWWRAAEGFVYDAMITMADNMQYHPDESVELAHRVTEKIEELDIQAESLRRKLDEVVTPEFEPLIENVERMLTDDLIERAMRETHEYYKRDRLDERWHSSLLGEARPYKLHTYITQTTHGAAFENIIESHALEMGVDYDVAAATVSNWMQESGMWERMQEIYRSVTGS